MKRGFSDYGPDETWEADVAIIGAGAGGAAAAARLAEDGHSVIMLEAGSHWKPSQFKPSSAWAFRNLYTMRNTRAAVGNAMIPVPGGRGVGGSTLVNSAICFRTPDVVLEDWVENYGCSRLSVAAMKPRLDRVWQTLQVVINPVAVQRNNNLIFKHGADKLGLPGEWMPRSAPGCVGCGVCQMGCPTGGKWSVDRNFIVEALATGGVTVNGDCRVESVEVEGGAVTALLGRTIDPVTLKASGRFRVRAKEYISSAGPVGSPRFLLSNGLSTADVCGAHLYLHPAGGMLGRFEQEIRPWSGVTQGFYVDRWEQGYLLQTYSANVDQAYVGMPWSLGPDLMGVLKDLKNMAMAGALVHDEDSTGSVSLAGLTYFLGDGDRRRMLAGLRECAEVFFAAGATEAYAPIIGSRTIKSPDDIARVITDDIPARRIYLYASHPMGTCRMGDDPTTSTIDPDGRVWGWENLSVADASVFPTSLGVNPQVTTMAVGLTIGEVVSQRLG
ncbi:MAG: GMC family oxidoreductase [Myxococcota bacterium]|nr:GMC family oxidoreductase [Myxococcota bacterium]